MGEVYAVRHTTLGGKFALKVINAEITERPEALERFRLEARAGYELDHPNIVRAQEFGDVDGRYFLRMQLMPGIETDQGIAVSLEDLQKKRGGRLQEREAVKYLEQILSGLKFAHEHGEGIIHRDLKPANILLSAGGAKIGDFGLVKAVGEDWIQSRVRLTMAMTQFIGMGTKDVESAITKFAEAEGLDIEDQKTMPIGTTAGAFMGTYDFMAPEQKEGREATVQSDLFAVGLMAYSMLTGEKTLGMNLPSEIIPSLNKSWDDWIKKAVNSNPQKRFVSASDMLDSLPLVKVKIKNSAAVKLNKLSPTKVITKKTETEVEEEAQPEKSTAENKVPGRRKSQTWYTILVFLLIISALFTGIYFLENGNQKTENRSQNVEALKEIIENDRIKDIGVTELSRVNGAKLGENWTIPELELQMVWIEPGTFTMGSPGNEAKRDDDEGPQTQVELTKGYWLGKYEVTQGEYETIMGKNPSRFKDVSKRAPVENVSWNEALDFCQKLTAIERRSGRLPEDYAYTLPTEAQWEYACRAGTTTPFGIGDGRNLSSQEANFGENYSYGYSNKGKYIGSTVEVGSYKPNRWGLYDMHGNVSEWCLNWYKDSLPGGSVSNPAGARFGLYRVDRGGGWGYDAQDCRSANRQFRFTPDGRFNLGFRLVLRPSP